MSETEPYRLVNTFKERKIRYGERRFGINLKWGLKEGVTNIHFKRMLGDGPLRAGDSVAIHVAGGGYLRQHGRTFGVDLVWNSTPVYHWIIRKMQGSDGSAIKTGDLISIYSKNLDASLVVRGNAFGIDLGWYAEHPDPTGNNPGEAQNDKRRRDWIITDSALPGSDVVPEVKLYRLLNRSQGQKIRYGERRFGINLKWGLKEGVTNIRFIKMLGSGPLRYGDKLAVHVDGGGYLRQHYRAFGVDLVWKSTPVYHWRIRGQAGSDGAIVKTGEAIAIYSETLDASLIYGSQTFGINLNWWLEHPPPGENP
ncbi:hypothetical protein [Streptomyces sp. NBC_00827]|uniref:hypothetical protein n=1 Tax=Streptomyces sp. NBC_00827 TaxID=2903677 RepID=UPI003863DBE6|nr:hypothetical protein OG569_10055 [Streptomyces sp. NBC_00827]